MKLSTRISAAVLILSAAASVAVAGEVAPVWKWTESGPAGRAPSPNLYYGGGVFNGLFYTGQLSYGPLAYAPTQTGDPPTAMAFGLDIADLEWVEGDTYNGARSTVLIGDYIYFNRTDKDPIAHPHPRLNRLNSDWSDPIAYSMDNNGGDLAPEGMTTDGTHLFTTQHTSKNVIRKYAITNYPDSFILTKTLDVPIAGAGTFRAISHYQGYLYVVDHAGAPPGIYEINATTGEYTRLGNHVTDAGAYQAVRYGNRLFVVGLDDNLTAYHIADGALKAGTTYSLGLGDLYGIGVLGTGAHVTGFWVTSIDGTVSFFSFFPCNRPFADADADRDVDMDDFGVFQRCFTGTAGSLPAVPESGYSCTCFDRDDANGVDATDLAAFEACMTGPAVPWAPSQDCP